MHETILSALATGAMPLSTLIETTQLPAEPLLAALRELTTAGKVAASRCKRGGAHCGPLLWRLAGSPAPRYRRRVTPTPVITVATLPSAGGYENHPPHSKQEVVERLAGNTTFRVPSGGFGGQPSTTLDDIDFELAHTEGTRLQRALAYAVATRDARLWPEVLELAYPHLVQVAARSPAHRALVTGARVVRLRFVLFDAFQALVGTPVAPKHRRARDAHIQWPVYAKLYDLAARELQAEADEVINNAVTALRA